MKHSYKAAFFAFLACGCVASYAAPLSPEQALARISTSGSPRKARMATGQPVLKYTFTDNQSAPAVYVFGNSDGNGFIIASADDAAFPLLGYSDNGSFDPSDIPPSLQYWLNQYASEISMARNSKRNTAASSSENPLEGKEAVGPLLKSKWNQGEPYNKYCFEISADGTQTQSVTGCVATAMAQVMYYFKQPSIGKGSISYKHGDSGTYEMDFASQAFNWADMLPTYYPGSYNDKQAEAVAYLMKACGYSVKMDYGKGESGANGASIAGALIDYFGYNQDIEVQTRAFYTYSDWASMIYDNLKNVGPVVYDGSALDGGHSFVCDGFDGNGYFHINWGWGGMSDGYYLLDALNPDEFGIGGAAGGYNLGQQIILNITPATGLPITPQLMQFGDATGKISDNTLSLKLDDSDTPGFQYINPSPVSLTFGVKVENISDSSQQPQYFQSDKTGLKASQGSFYRWDEVGRDIDLSKVNMTEGDEYRFIIGTEITDGTSSQWNEVVAVPGRYNYVTIEKTGSGYRILDNTPGEITVSDFRILSSPVYWNVPVKFSAVFENESSAPLTRNYSAVFFNSEGKEFYKMENYSVNVDAGDSQSVEWTSVDWYKENGAGDVTQDTEFTVKLYDNWLGEYVEGIEQTVTVEPEAGKAKVESTMEILNARKEGDVYVIDGDNLEISLTVKVTEGIFNHTIMLALQQSMTNGDYMTVMHKHFDAIPNLSAGEEQTYTMTVQIDDIDPSLTYRVEVWGPDGGFNETALVKFDTENSAISSIAPDANGHYTVYRLDGTLQGVYTAPDYLPSLPPGIYIVNGRKIIL